MDIETFIQNEKAYFHPMMERQANTSEEQKMQWRSETVHERRRRVSLEVFRLLNGRVTYGPFQGLVLSEDTWWGKSDLGAMLLGLYEKEILNLVSAIDQGQYDTFIDVGAADGYYACGMLLSGKVSRAVCFEQNEFGRKVITSNWEANGSTGKLDIYGEANSHAFSQLSDINFRKSLMLIDVEGAEFDLMTAEFLDAIAGITAIIEIHNWVANFTDRYSKLLRRCDKNFDVSVIERAERPTTRMYELRDFTDDNRLLVTSEGRPCLMRFLKLTPKASAV